MAHEQGQSENNGSIYEALGQLSLSDIGEVLALKAQMEQQQQVAKWKQELASTLARIEELKARRQELTALEEGDARAEAQPTI